MNEPLAVSRPEKIWVGPNSSKLRVFVLGESWYGSYSDDLVTDDGYIQAYLKGQQQDAMYSRIANACMGGKSLQARHDYWNGVLFTNFVQCVGGKRTDRPTSSMFKAACPRLAELLDTRRPRGVWILGIGQAEHSAPVVAAAGIPFEVTAHPTSYGLKNATLGASWKTLLARLKAPVVEQ